MDELDEMTIDDDKDKDRQQNDDEIKSELPFSARKIYSDQGNLEIRSLHDKKKEGDLILQPDFQRGFVWDSTKCSRLIESALLGIPIPMIYLSEEPDGKEYVIDGQQRLTAFFSFIDGHYPKDSDDKTKDFTLEHLRSFPQLNGKYFRNLPRELQKKISSYKIITITFKKESDPNLKFEMFERLNTGAVQLNDQELRNCIYRGKYNQLLIKLSEYADFKDILGIQNPERRMRDVELVLRFAAFYHKTERKYKPPMKEFLNEDMRRYRSIDDADAANLEKAFKTSVKIIKSILGRNAFKRYKAGSVGNPDGTWEIKKFNYSLYDILMYSFSYFEEPKIRKNIDIIKESLIYLMANDADFIRSIEISTSSSQAVKTRFDKWLSMLQNIIGISEKERRYFTKEEKQKLWDENEKENKICLCDICHQEIQDIDDANVDHIEQYWRGGKTIRENARLTHRYCNLARPKSD